MSVELVYQDQLLSTGCTIELVTQEISVSLESVALGVSLDLSVSSPVAVELEIVESLIAVELSMTPILSSVQLTNPQFTYLDGVLTRIDYDGNLYKTFAYTSGLLSQVDFFDGTKTVRKTFHYQNGVLDFISQVTL